MLDLAIVGGGVCGLALARAMRGQGISFALFEARPRLGGRVLSRAFKTGLIFDLGPGWFWPDTQPYFVRMIADLGLDHFPQHDSGPVLVLADPEKSPRELSESVHQGARRLVGGMASLVQALSEELPAEALRLDHVLTAVRDRGDHVELHFRNEADPVILARRVVLALPPRLLDEHVVFSPRLEDEVQTSLRDAPTWMAAQAKAGVACERADWREKGLSGNAFVSHEQAVLGEVFDACDGTGDKAALGGFLALPADLRASFQTGLPLLIGNQMAQLFGPEVEKGEQMYQDWADEIFTCAALDRMAPAQHPDYQIGLLRQPFWGGRLFFGGSETAQTGAGYLEGALDAAARLADLLQGQPDMAGLDATCSVNEASLALFGAWVAEQRRTVFGDYRQRLNRALAAQQADQLTQRAMLETMENIFRQALVALQSLPFESAGVTVENGRSSLMPAVQTSFQDFIQAFLDDVLAFNRASCALSNFPDEHRVSKAYLQVILADIAAAWKEFLLDANDMFRDRLSGTDSPGLSVRDGLA